MVVWLIKLDNMAPLKLLIKKGGEVYPLIAGDLWGRWRCSGLTFGELICRSFYVFLPSSPSHHSFYYMANVQSSGEHACEWGG